MKKIIILVTSFLFTFTSWSQKTDSLKVYESKREVVFSSSLFTEQYRTKNQFSTDSVNSFGFEERMRLNRRKINSLFIFLEIKYEVQKSEDFANNGPSNFFHEEGVQFGGGFGSNFKFFSIGKKIHFGMGLDTKLDIIRSTEYGIVAITMEPFLELSYHEKCSLEAGLRLDPYLATLNCPSVRFTYLFF